jgi:D-hydroxyproline dehydrogenase subunit gamma
MFQRLRDIRQPVRLTIDGEAVTADAGDSVMAAILASGIASFRRTPQSGAERGPYCGMGVCFDCLVTIDGRGNRQACLAVVREGMVVESGGARPAIGGP